MNLNDFKDLEMLGLCILAPKEVCFIMLKNEHYIDELWIDENKIGNEGGQKLIEGIISLQNLACLEIWLEKNIIEAE